MTIFFNYLLFPLLPFDIAILSNNSIYTNKTANYYDYYNLSNNNNDEILFVTSNL
jgi:hypothetical protein